MSKEHKSKRLPSSIIARLMGLEVLPTHNQPAHKQPERSSENHRKRTESVRVVGKNTPYDGCSFRKCLNEEQQFKDVFEVVNTKKVVNSNYPLQRNSNPKAQNTKRFDNNPEILDSNTDNEPNSLFAKHFHDLQQARRKASDRENIMRNNTNSSIKFHYDRNTENHAKYRRVRFEDKDETYSVPKNIVLLKPNLGNVHKHVQGRRNLLDDVGPSRYKSKEARETSENIVRRKKTSRSVSSRDDSVISHSFDWRDRNMISSSSSTNWEAKGRLSERWKMSHKFQEVGLVHKRSSLGELLANSDREIMIEKTESVNSGVITSKDGWKNGCVNNLSRSTSLPSSSLAFESPEKSLKSGIFCNNIHLTPKEAGANLRTNRAVKKRSIRKEGSLSNNSKPTSKKKKSFRCVDRYNHESKNRMEKHVEMGDVEHKNMVVSSQYTGDFLAERSTHVSVRYDSPTRDLNISATKETSNKTFDEGPRSPSSPVREPECSTSSKDTDQPSPVSVLEVVCQDDDLSCSSDCFVSLSADLQGLRKQLQLLKLESEEYEEGTMALSSDGDLNEEESTSILTNEVRKLKSEENWKSSFLDNVLLYFGLGNANLGSILTTYHALESPLDESIFPKLVKKYSYENVYEARLFFDRINSGLVEISEKFMNQYPWVNVKVNSLEKRVRFSIRVKDMIEDCLTSQEKKAGNEDFTDEVVGTESRWSEFEEEIDGIGIELEKVLLDELVFEVVAM